MNKIDISLYNGISDDNKSHCGYCKELINVGNTYTIITAIKKNKNSHTFVGNTIVHTNCMVKVIKGIGAS